MNKMFVDNQWLSESLYFMKNMWKIIIVVIAGILVSILVTTNVPSIYRAQATYYLNKSDLNSAYFTINEYQFYNLLLLDVEKMLESNKFYREVMTTMEQDLPGSRLTYKDFLAGLFMEIDTDSTFFVVGFEHSNPALAENVSETIERAIVKETSSIIRITSVELVDQTVLLTQPVAPDKGMNILLGGLGGLFIGSLIVLIGYVLTKKVNSYVDVMSLTNQNILCHAKFKPLRNMNVDRIFDHRRRDDYQLVKQFLLYDKELHGQKVYSVLSNDESGKNEIFALALAGHLAGSGEKTLYIPINPTDDFKMLMADTYGKQEVSMKNLEMTSRYASIVEEAVDSLDILLGTNRMISFTQDKVAEIDGLIHALENNYDVIILSVGLEEKLIFHLMKRGAFMLAVSNKSKKQRVKNNVRCLDGFEARVLGAVYQE